MRGSRTGTWVNAGAVLVSLVQLYSGDRGTEEMLLRCRLLAGVTAAPGVEGYEMAKAITLRA